MDPVTISMLVSAGASAIQAYNSYADQKEAQKAAQRLGAQLRATQEADKVSGLQVPTLGSELARQSLGQQMAMTVNALTGAGAAGVLGGIPGVSAMGANAALEIAADLQRQQAARDQFVVAAQQGIEARRVAAEREMIGDQLQGAQLQAAAAGNQKNQAIATGIGALGKAAAAEIGAQPLFEDKSFKVEDNMGQLGTGVPSITKEMTQLNLQPAAETRSKNQSATYALGYDIAPPGLNLPQITFR